MRPPRTAGPRPGTTRPRPGTTRPRPGTTRLRPRLAPPGATLVVTVVVTLGIAACGDTADRDVWTVTADTLPGGVVHIVNIPPAAGIEATWVVEEEVRIGTVDEAGPSSFGQIKGLAVDEAGRVFVLDAQAQELRVFGPDGQHQRTFGRRGEGPGEFADANGIMRAADGRIWVVDPPLARFSRFHPERGFEASYRWERRSWGFVWDGALDREGRVLEPTFGEWNGERWRILRVYDPEMELLDSLPVQPAPPPGTRDFPGGFRWEATGAWGFVPVPFYSPQRLALDPGLAYWSTGDGDPSYRVARWVPGGDTTLIIEARRPAIPVRAAERDSAIAAIREQLQQRGAEARPDWSRIPGVRPAIAGLFLAEAGDVWVRVTTTDPGLTTWDVFSPDGRYAGTAVAPLRPSAWVHPVVRGDRFWAVVMDELDVQYVVAGRLRAAGGAAAGE